MTFEQFDQFQQALIAEVTEMRDTKGKEYANDADRFANFRRLSAQIGMKDYQIGWVYGVKHLDAIASYMKSGREFSSEGIRGRFVDAITYLTLIAGMIYEAQMDGLPTIQEMSGLLGRTDSNRSTHVPTEEPNPLEAVEVKPERSHPCLIKE
jgi:hypothetical protein